MAVPLEAEVRQRPNTLALAAIAVCGVMAGAVVGATTNAVNGWVGPNYFVEVLRWPADDTVYTRSIAQGVLEGVLFGVAFSLVYTVAAGVITEACCSFGFLLKHLLGIVGGVYAFWLLGGALAMALAALQPAFFQAFRPGAEGWPLREVLGFAWVGGSIWGAQIGGLFWVVVGLVILRINWRHRGLTGAPK